MSIQERIIESQIKAGEAAIKYCIEHGLAGWYVVNRVKFGRGSSSKSIRGPYTTFDKASDSRTHHTESTEFLTKEEAAKLTY